MSSCQSGLRPPLESIHRALGAAGAIEVPQPAPDVVPSPPPVPHSPSTPPEIIEPPIADEPPAPIGEPPVVPTDTIGLCGLQRQLRW